jgi:hypothetical protein
LNPLVAKFGDVIPSLKTIILEVGLGLLSPGSVYDLGMMEFTFFSTPSRNTV